MNPAAEILADLATLARDARATAMQTPDSDAPRLRAALVELFDTMEHIIIRTSHTTAASSFIDSETIADEKALK